LQNKAFIVIVSAIIVVQFTMVQASGKNGEGVIGEIFRTVPLLPMQWLGIVLLTATIVPVSWAIRWGIRQMGLEEQH
jgi:hypothetical protein